MLRRRVVTYGRAEDADVRMTESRSDGPGRRFAVDVPGRPVAARVTLPVPGEHMALNATGVLAVGMGARARSGRRRRGSASFGGVRRRFEHVGRGRPA